MLQGISPFVFSCWLLERSINYWPVIFPTYIHCAPWQIFWTSLTPYLASGMLLFHANLQRYLFSLCGKEREKQNEQQCCSITFPARCVLAEAALQPGHSLCPLCPRCRCCTSWYWDLWLRGTLVQGLSLQSNLARNKYLILVPGERWRELGCFPKLAPFNHKASPKGNLFLSYLVLRLWKVCQKKRGNNFFFFFPVRAAWRHYSWFLLCTPLSKANPCSIVGGRDLYCSKLSYSWPYLLADSQEKSHGV